MTDLFQRENQVFKPTALLVLPHYGKAMSLPCTSKNTLRFLALVKQKFDMLLFLCIICHGTFPVFWYLSLQVLDQKCFAAREKLNYIFFSFNDDS